MEALFAWLPVIIIGVMLIVVGRWTSRTYNSHVEKVNEINEQLVEINREMIAELREIKEILRDRT